MPDLKSSDTSVKTADANGIYNNAFSMPEIDTDGNTPVNDRTPGEETSFSNEKQPQNGPDENTEVETTPGDKEGTAEYLIFMQEDFEDVVHNPGPCMRGVNNIQSKFATFFNKHGHIFRFAIYAGLLCGYIAYFGYAMYYEQLSVLESITLLWVTCLTVFLVVVSIVKDKRGEQIYNSCWAPVLNFIENRWTIFKWGFIIIVAVLFVVIVGVVIGNNEPYNLVSLGGAIVFLTLGFIFSANPGAVNWRIVSWGLGLQFTIALIVLRTTAGYESFKWLGDFILIIINFVEAGVLFVFDTAYVDHFFAMRVMPVIIYLCAVIALLYHWGVIQVVVEKFGWFMEICIGTTAGESTAAAGNVFLGQNEAPMLIAPLLGRMTDSEIHCVMTGGFSTIAGSVMASFILLGVPANHLISASIISAPCALAISKLSMPETKKSKFKKGEAIEFESRNYQNGFDAACQGAIEGVTIVGCIIGNLIAFLSMLALVNGLLTWMGNRVGATEPVTFELICSYVLWPAAFCLGVPAEDCTSVAELLGVKMFVNEFIAYLDLTTLLRNGACFRYHLASNGTFENIGRNIFLVERGMNLTGGAILRRSEIISTYAICGFANVGSIGIQLGMFSTLVPAKVKGISAFIVRALLAGTMTSYLTACTAGLLYDPELEEAGMYDLSVDLCNETIWD